MSGIPAFAGMTKLWLFALLFLAATFFVLGGCRDRVAEAPLPVRLESGAPLAPAWVADTADIIPDEREPQIAAQLKQLELETTDQVVVVTVQSLAGRPIEDVATDLANSWEVGRNDWDNGVLLLVAPNERQVRIAVGYGLEGLLTDARAAETIVKMLPSFRAGIPVEAIERGVSDITTVLRSDKRRPQRIEKKDAA